jgi:hypothetical protein
MERKLAVCQIGDGAQTMPAGPKEHLFQRKNILFHFSFQKIRGLSGFKANECLRGPFGHLTIFKVKKVEKFFSLIYKLHISMIMFSLHSTSLHARSTKALRDPTAPKRVILKL